MTRQRKAQGAWWACVGCGALALSIGSSLLGCSSSLDSKKPDGGSLPGAGGGGMAGSASDGSSGQAPGAETGPTVDSATPADSGSSSNYPTSCDDLGPEPVIAPACSTLLATRTTTDGKPTDETTLDTRLIQDAINTCPAGQSVQLAVDGDKNAFLSGPLTMKAGVTLWIDAGTTLFASRDPRSFDSTPGQCGLAGSGNSSCYALINVRGTGVSVAGLGTIDGRGGEPVIGDPASATWWDLENLSGGTLAAPRLIQVSASRDFTLYNITLRNSPKFHVVIDSSNGYRVWGITINTPASSPNTDGVDPSASINGVIAYTKITTGDDNIAVKGGGPIVVDNLIVAHNHFGRGHGMSIGSETNGGVRNVKVCDLSLDGAQNGLRIKSDSSRGGLVQAISYTDVCMRGVRNPLVFDPYYTTAVGTLIPVYTGISVKNAHVLGAAGSLRLRGYDANRPLDLLLDNVVFDVAPSVTAQDCDLVKGPGPVNITPTGPGVAIADVPAADAAPLDCDNAWVTF